MDDRVTQSSGAYQEFRVPAEGLKLVILANEVTEAHQISGPETPLPEIVDGVECRVKPLDKNALLL